MKLRYITSSCALFILLSACGGSAGNTTTQIKPTEITSIPEGTEFPPVYRTPEGVEECSTEDIKLRVDFDMRDYYIYYDQVPTLNLDDYDSPETLIRDLRVDPDVYSNVGDAADQSALNNDGVSGGFGFWFSPVEDDGSIRFREILIGSPADSQGILRGDELVEFNGVAIEDVSNDEIREALDPDNAPVSMLVRTGVEAPREVSVDHADFNWQTAGPSSIITVDDPASQTDYQPVVAYLPIRRFLETTRDEIDDAFAFFQDQGGFNELVVDLRYNPGGRTNVTRYLASIVGGEAVENEVFLIRSWNDKYSGNDSTDFFEEVENPWNLRRVIVLVTEFSASASEVFINTLEPYIDVVVIGGITNGKPFTSNVREYCGKSINAMRSVRTNAVGVSVAGGIQSDCPVTDSWSAQGNNYTDPLFGAAYAYARDDTCPLIQVASTPAFRSAVVQGPSYRTPELMVPED